MSFKDECLDVKSDKIIVLLENKMRFIFKNDRQIDVTIIKVDGCQINDNSIRCDYMAMVDEIEYYIELKGKNIKHAIAQLEATINKLSQDMRKQNKKAFIISTRSPLSSPQIQITAKQFKKKYNAEFTVRNRLHEEVI